MAGGGPSSGVLPVLGTMTFGAEGQVKPAEVGVLLRSFCGAKCAATPAGALLDTARIYQSASEEGGDTESTLGRAFESFPSLQAKASVATKAIPFMPPHFSLSRQSVVEQCNTSLERLGLDCVDLFYLHSPDIKTDIEDTLSGIEQLHKEGKIKEFGLSNYPAWAVVDIWHRCRNRGMVKPTVYQGMYNAITRDMEREIVPVAREFGIRLYMYNPLAGGMLTGRYSCMEDLSEASEGRFSASFERAFGPGLKAATIYKSRYSKQPIFDALSVIKAACAPAAVAESKAESPKIVEQSDSTVDGVRVRVEVTEVQGKTEAEPGLDMAGVALRWLIHHSCLRSGDGVIIGVSKQSQLVANLAAWHAGPLPQHVLDACDAAWELARPVCEAYFRGYGARPGGIERFLALKAEAQEEKDSAEKRARTS